MQAMILAAGFGTRLLPHTLAKPKPLFPICNQPLLLLTIRRLQSLGFRRIVVNCHHLRDQVVRALDGLAGVVVQEEEVILGTGGGLRRALDQLDDRPLLVTNGDIYHTVDPLELYRCHEAGGRPVTLAMHDYPRFNTVQVEGGRILGFDREDGGEPLAYTGLQVVEPSVLEAIADHRCSCIIDHYRQLLKEGRELGCYRADGCFWTDMGTVADYLALHQGLLTAAIPCWPELEPLDKPYCLADPAGLDKRCELAGWAAIGRARIEDGCHLERVVVWDEVVVGRGSHLVDCIVSSDYERR